MEARGADGRYFIFVDWSVVLWLVADTVYRQSNKLTPPALFILVHNEDWISS